MTYSTGQKISKTNGLSTNTGSQTLTINTAAASGSVQYIKKVVAKGDGTGITKLIFEREDGTKICFLNDGLGTPKNTCQADNVATDTILDNIFLIAIDTQYQSNALVSINFYYVTNTIGIAAAV